MAAKVGVRLVDLDAAARDVLGAAGQGRGAARPTDPLSAAGGRPAERRLRRNRRSTARGHLGDISAAIGCVARAAGYGLHTDFGGHGIGRTMHESPHIPNDGRPGRGRRLEPGLTIAIEPWFLAGGQDAFRVDEDGWTLRSTDGSRGAHFEHTLAVTDDGPRILTALT